MEENLFALVMFVVSMLVVAVIMELVKAGKTKLPVYWWILSAVISAVCSLSVWFGTTHDGNLFLLPLVLIVGYTGQYVIDMKLGVKKVLTYVFNAWAKKHGYVQLGE